eukprot:TRINITY_DN1147_c0_g1_i1.p1 TRINITY_DN1147_c0_g1~~TRINITY_DN1147_c0_g1_i1.p1  ORF type:complete len:308 (+),score=61.10 TRINITY_DN1147_c0_g1_i1:71-994(+)
MTLNASATPFVMMLGLDDDAKLHGNGEAGACSTCAPSPSMTPSLSPYDSPAYGPLACGAWGQMGWSPYMPDLALPTAEEVTDQADFELTGLESLQNSLASMLAKHIPSGTAPASESQEAKPPGLAPPPGLMPPPGLEQNVVDLPKGCTTVMLRNIPNKYSREKLAEQLRSDGFGRDVDFIYLPIDFRNKCNVGYAFLNFRTPEACLRFAGEYHQRDSTEKLPGFKSRKICEVSEARCQGRQENVRRLQASQVMQQLAGHPDWLPLLFDTDGKEEEFHVPHLMESAKLKVSDAKGKGKGRVARCGQRQ